MSSSIVVRVAVNNNFNCTVAEFAQLDELAKLHPHSVFFLNSNIKTPNLLKVNDHPYQVVVTLNPDVDIKDNLVQRLYHIASDNVAFVRIKYVPHHPEIIDLIHKVSESFPVVITLQRFNGKKSISTIVPDYPNHYMFSHNRYRLFGDSLKEVESLVKPDNNIHICDQLGLGCGGCGLCSTLTTGESYPIYTLNLSSSGLCRYNCCDCYAKTMQRFVIALGYRPIIFNKIHRNEKQKGTTKHILYAKNLLKQFKGIPWVSLLT